MTDQDGGEDRRIELRVGNTAVDTTAGTGQKNSSAGGGAYQTQGATASAQAARPESQPIMGWIAVGFGLLGIFTYGVVFVPIAFVCSIIALFMGQVMWGFLGLLTAFAGLMTSPVLLAILGLGALAAYFGIPI